ncbi:hypothetical protein A7982_12062 [Minicystis rosea]|nr:hypothetical protein A7982_12062 [Minicystis rosea]
MKTQTLPENTSLSLATRIVLGCVMVVGLVLGTGCATVAPYERGKLAHPTMVAGDMSGFAEAHVRAIHEGAVGGSGGTGSGCGCN